MPPFQSSTKKCLRIVVVFVLCFFALGQFIALLPDAQPLNPKALNAASLEWNTSNAKLVEEDHRCRDLMDKNISIPPLQLPNALGFSLGKAGCGAAHFRKDHHWKIVAGSCHVAPCPEKINNATQIVMHVRDPIDRFVSAFNWRAKELCNPDGDRRREGRKVSYHINRRCERGRKEESDAIFYKYRQNVSTIAQALCSDPQQTKLDVKLINHARHFIDDWLRGFDWKQNNAQNLFPLVMEHGFNFENEIDRAFAWWVASAGHDVRDRLRNVALVDCKIQHNALEPVIARTLVAAKHTTTTESRPKLSSEGEVCLAGFFARDYQLLQNLQELACKTVTCRASIQSIMNRRKRLLNAHKYE